MFGAKIIQLILAPNAILYPKVIAIHHCFIYLHYLKYNI